MRTWAHFLQLQTKYAYGDSHSAPSPNTAREHEILRGWLLRLRDDKPMTHALVIGPGSAHELNALRDVLPPDVTALTAHNPEARALVGAADRVMFGDVHQMPFPCKSFDLVHASNVLEHVLAPYCALMDIRRVLRPGGIASFVTPGFRGDEAGVGPFHLHCLDEHVWVELLRKTGFTVADVVRQDGVSAASSEVYYHFRCVAGEPPPPHDQILANITMHMGQEYPAPPGT